MLKILAVMVVLLASSCGVEPVDDGSCEREIWTIQTFFLMGDFSEKKRLYVFDGESGAQIFSLTDHEWGPEGSSFDMGADGCISGTEFVPGYEDLK